LPPDLLQLTYAAAGGPMGQGPGLSLVEAGSAYGNQGPRSFSDPHTSAFLGPLMNRGL